MIGALGGFDAEVIDMDGSRIDKLIPRRVRKDG